MAVKRITELLPDVPGALCAFNLETLDGIIAAFTSAARHDVPFIAAFTPPAAEALGYSLVSSIIAHLSDETGVPVALHLDHCNSPEEVHQAVAAGFTSINYLGEGRDAEAYPVECLQLREGYPDIDFEFSVDSLQYGAEHAHGFTADQILAKQDAALKFLRQTSPDLLTFDMGSSHGMSERTVAVDLSLVDEVYSAVGRPLVLHGSSGVDMNSMREVCGRGVKKVNVETALRRVQTEVASEFLASSPNRGKPRYMSVEVRDALEPVLDSYLLTCTLLSA